MTPLELAAVRARTDQYGALVHEISTDPLARARLADRLIAEHLRREAEEIRRELDAPVRP